MQELSEEKQNCLKQLMEQRKGELINNILNEQGIHGKKTRAKRKQEPAFVLLLEKRLETDAKYQSYRSGEFAATEEFASKLEKFMPVYLKEKLKKEKEEQTVRKWEEWKEEDHLSEVVDDAVEAVSQNLIHKLQEVLATDRLYTARWERSPYFRHIDIEELEIAADTVNEFVDEFFDSDNYLSCIELEDDNMLSIIYNKMLTISPEFAKLKEEIDQTSADVNNDIWDVIFEKEDDVRLNIQNVLTKEKIKNLIMDNPHYKAMLQQADLLKQQIWESIPENIPDLFPLARTMHRHFILHVGPTNSGKTFRAIEALKRSGNGIYLAPLRLMAYEAYENLTNDGLSCGMLTGEEEIDTPEAKWVSMTIELADLTQKYDVAVIDEAQMISDISRGGAWTNAILGLPVKEIHVCMAPEAEDLIINLIRLCDDTYEINHYERKTPLVPDPKLARFPKDVERGDACIVFSKAKVIACAAQLQENGKKCSIIYGDLPYESRRNEIKKFADGETDVIVSTDAIGMGMNVPIRRVVFLETRKFDGISMRELTVPEVKQIAGRAGRFGKFDVGYYTTEFYSGTKLQNKMQTATPKLTTAYFGFPEKLKDVTGKLSSIINQWMEMKLPDIFEKQKLNDMLSLAKECERHTDDKMLIYAFMTIPFDIRNNLLYSVFRQALQDVKEHATLDINEYLPYASISQKNNLQTLEKSYKMADLLYNLFRKFGTKEDLAQITDLKKQISQNITEILSKQALKPKSCKYCGKILPWNYSYSMCQNCHDKMFPKYYSYDDLY